MKKILKLNAISKVADPEYPSDYEVCDAAESPDGIILRSFDMHGYDLPDTVLAVARAGAGTNNIPCKEYADKGVVVFNTPGANANAVKELVLSALFLGSRKIVDSIAWVNGLKGKGEEIPTLVEKGKKNFVGPEIMGKTLGIIGLGAIGGKVANAAVALGMKVVGYDPYLSVDSALMISEQVKRVATYDDLVSVSDYVTVHVPYLKDNAGFINADFIAKMKDGAVLINCARGELVDEQAVLAAVRSKKLARYVTDFASDALLAEENVICTPHLGASTPEAEDNCAVMAAKELVDYLENGNITNSVNFPACSSPKTHKTRVTLAHLNQNSMIAKITTVLGDDNVNIENLVNKSKGDYAYTIIDTDDDVSKETAEDLKKISGIIRVRVL